MSRRRFYAPLDAFENGVVTLASDEARHLRDVLRLKTGDEAFVFDGEGREYSAIVTETGRGKSPARLEIRDAIAPLSPESSLTLTLAVALLKGEKFDLVVQKTTELGVSRIVPVITRRSDVKLRETFDAERRVTRWRRLALEACKQSGRARLPSIESPVPLSSLFRTERKEEAKVMFAERSGREIVDELAGVTRQSMTALVGPEGGWEDDEIVLARHSGWYVVTLGGRTLRAETAAITVTVLIQHLFGDLK